MVKKQRGIMVEYLVNDIFKMKQKRHFSPIWIWRLK